MATSSSIASEAIGFAIAATAPTRTLSTLCVLQPCPCVPLRVRVSTQSALHHRPSSQDYPRAADRARIPAGLQSGRRAARTTPTCRQHQRRERGDHGRARRRRRRKSGAARRLRCDGLQHDRRPVRARYGCATISCASLWHPPRTRARRLQPHPPASPLGLASGKALLHAKVLFGERCMCAYWRAVGW